MNVRLEEGDCLEVMLRLKAEDVKFDAGVCDPPYHLTSIVKRFGGPNASPARDGDVYSLHASHGPMVSTAGGRAQRCSAVCNSVCDRSPKTAQNPHFRQSAYQVISTAYPASGNLRI